MEKFIRRVSAVITFLLIYTFGAYSYLSGKGFVYQNGSFHLIKEADASFLDTDFSQSKSFATPVRANVALNLPAKASLGSQSAPFTIYEFSSLGCTHCADFHLNVLKKLEKEYFSTGKVKVIFVHFPLEKRSMQAAMLAECVPSKNKNSFMATVFQKQREWMLSSSPEKLLQAYAMAAGLSKTGAEKCIKDESLAKEIIANRQEALDKLNINGTPAFLFVSGKTRELRSGVPSFDELKTYIDSHL